ncbi:MAG: hypothetical protein ABIW83_09675 [Allosphingosinicella sp.]
MDAPKGRYRVVEKDGRLIVIDHQADGPTRPMAGMEPLAGRGGLPASPSGPVAPAGPRWVDRAADFLLACVATEWDGEGRAVIAWKRGEAGNEARWDARLDQAQQRRMGRALLALCATPVFLLFLIFGDGSLLFFAAPATLPFVISGAVALARLYAETNDPSLRE